MAKLTHISLLMLSTLMLILAVCGFFTPGQANIQSFKTSQIDDAMQTVSANQNQKLFSEVRSCQDFSSSVKQVTHKVARGESLTSIWQKFGAINRGAISAARAIKAAGLKDSRLKAGDELVLSLKGDEVIALEKKLQAGQVLKLVGDSSSGYNYEVFIPKVHVRKRVVSGTITTSFFQAASEQNVPYSVIDELVDLFSSRVEFSRNMQLGDTFTIIYNERYLEDGTAVEPGAIIAASLDNLGSFMAAIRHEHDGKAKYFDERGKPLGNYFLRYPLNFTRISIKFF